MKRLIGCVLWLNLCVVGTWAEAPLEEQEESIRGVMGQEPVLMRLIQENPEFGKLFLQQPDQQQGIDIVPADEQKTEVRRTTQFEAFLRQELGRIDRQLWNVLHNLSHDKTCGYKAVWYEFPSPLPNFSGDSERVTLSEHSGTVAIRVDMAHGATVKTGRALDVAINGPGFFKIKKPKNGTWLYTRSGRLTLDQQGRLALLLSLPPAELPKAEKPVINGAAEIGYSVPLQPEIVIPPGTPSFKISPKGNVWVRDTDGNETSVGHLEVVAFPMPQRLRPVDERFFEETVDSGRPFETVRAEKGQTTLLQGYLEESNVNNESLQRELRRLRDLREWYLNLLQP